MKTWTEDGIHFARCTIDGRRLLTFAPTRAEAINYMKELIGERHDRS